jgi:hypothetical protein
MSGQEKHLTLEPLMRYSPNCVRNYRGPFRKESFKGIGILRTFLDHAEHEVHQLFERHYTLPAEILLSFFCTVCIVRFF